MIGMYNDSSTCTILTERLIRGHVMRHRVSRIQIASSERMFSSTSTTVVLPSSLLKSNKQFIIILISNKSEFKYLY